MKKRTLKKTVAMAMCVMTLTNLGTISVSAAEVNQQSVDEAKSQEMKEWMENYREEYEKLKKMSYYERLEIATDEQIANSGWDRVIEIDSVKYCMNGSRLMSMATKENEVSEIVIPSEIKEIDNEAFYNINLKEDAEILLHKDIRDIGKLSFYYLTNLEEIVVDELNEKYCSVDGVLYTKDMKMLISYPSMKEAVCYSVPQSVDEINNWAFGMYTNLQNVIYNDKTSIDNVMFYTRSFVDMNDDGKITLDDAQKALRIVLKIDDETMSTIQTVETSNKSNLTLDTVQDILKMALKIQ